MPELFDPITIGTLTIRNRLMRSATAEWLADPETGAPQHALGEMYRRLAEGGIGLIVTGHACVAFSGRTSPRMCAIADDGLVEPWREAIRPAQEAGAQVMIQINYGASNVDPAIVSDPVSPSGVRTNETVSPRALREGEIHELIAAFGRAAHRAREAGFDGVQLHGAHGYLINQFLTPQTNLRDDAWGGDPRRRMAFLQAVHAEVRRQVGPGYPVWIKLGVAGNRESGLTIPQGALVAAACAEMGMDCVEISHGLGIPECVDRRSEASYRPMAEAVRSRVGRGYPLALVSGFRTLPVMEGTLRGGLAQLISLSRPLIAEPDLPRKFEGGLTQEVACVRCDQCRPREPDQGVACRNQQVLSRLGV